MERPFISLVSLEMRKNEILYLTSYNKKDMLMSTVIPLIVLILLLVLCTFFKDQISEYEERSYQLDGYKQGFCFTETSAEGCITSEQRQVALHIVRARGREKLSNSSWYSLWGCRCPRNAMLQSCSEIQWRHFWFILTMGDIRFWLSACSSSQTISWSWIHVYTWESETSEGAVAIWQMDSIQPKHHSF